MSSSLFNIISVGGESLLNSRVGVDVTGHNISNSHSPGYSRQRVNTEPRPGTSFGQYVIGNGANIQAVERVHDKYVESQIRKEIQNTSEKDALAKGLSKLEGIFNPELNSTIRERFNQFFNAARELSNYPDEPSVRTNMVESGLNLTATFNSTYNEVRTIQEDCSNELRGEIGTLNQKLEDIAKLNVAIKELVSGNRGNANDLEDKRDAIVKDIGEIININVYKDGNDLISIRGPGDYHLVDGLQASKLFLDSEADSDLPKLKIQDSIGHNTVDISKMVTSGKIGGTLNIRDKFAAGLRNSINDLCKGFVDKFNEIHRMGYGQKEFEETNGRDFFVGTDSKDPAGTVNLSLIVYKDPGAISTALTPSSPGDNIIANEFVRLAGDPIFDDKKSTISAYYDKTIAKLGVESMKAQEDYNVAKVVMAQLESQKEATSGVSLDEEAASLLKFQHLFAASSRIITTADEMLKTVLDLKR